MFSEHAMTKQTHRTRKTRKANRIFYALVL